MKIKLCVNSDKKTVVLVYFFEYGGSSVFKEKCSEEDKFDWKIGLGLCLSKIYGRNQKWKKHREFFRNKNTHKLDYKKYSYWCINEIFNNNQIVLNDIENQLKKSGEVDFERFFVPINR